MRTIPTQGYSPPTYEDDHARRRALGHARRNAIARDLEVLRMRLESLLRLWYEREAQAGRIDPEVPWQARPHPMKTCAIDRIEGHLDRIAVRIGNAFYGAGPTDA